MPRSLIAAVLIALAAASLAAPVPAAKKNQWLIASSGHLYLFTEGDKELKKVTSGKSVNMAPAWSPDGKQFAYCSKRDGGFHIYTMNADGKNEKQITQDDANRSGQVNCGFPSWHPNGKLIVFSRSFSEKSSVSDSEICVVNSSDGSDLRVLTNSDDDYPSFSPDGKAIAFLSARGAEGYRLYKMDADGRNATKLSDETAFGSITRPSWSSDGKTIAFGIDTHGAVEIHVIRADGTGLKVLTKFGQCAAWPTWSPDGKHIVFVLRDYLESDENKHTLWLMDADGKNQRDILKMDNPHLAYPAWRPK